MHPKEVQAYFALVGSSPPFKLYSSLFVSNGLWSAVYREADTFGTTQESSTPSKPTNPGGRITATFSTEGELEGYAAEIVHVYFDGDIPEAKYDTHSDPSTFYLTSRVYEVIRESGDEPLVVLPQPFPPVPPSVQNLPTQTTNTAGAATTTQFPTTTHADVAPQKTFKPQTSNTAQLHPFLQPNPTARTPGKQTPNKGRTWAQVVAKGNAGTHNRR